MIYSIYKKSTGEITSQFSGSLENLQLNVNTETQGYIEGNYPGDKFYIENNAPVAISAQPNSWSFYDPDTKQWVVNDAAAKQYCIERRNKLLASSDWTQMPDVTLANKPAWATYRQALRDITAQTGYPFNIVWPTPPQ